MAFDPDAYLAKGKKGGFNPDEYLSAPAEGGHNGGAVADLVGSITTHDVEPPRGEPTSIPGKLASYLKRIYGATKESMLPPTSVDAMKRLLSPSAGKYGVGRFMEEEGKRVGASVRKAGDQVAEDFVSLPGVRQFPRVAAVPAAFGSAAVDMMSDSLTPSSTQLSLGMEGAGKIIEETAPYLRNVSRNASRRSLGYTKGNLNERGALERANAVGDTMREKGVITPMATTDDMLKRGAELEASSGKAIGDVMSGLDAQGATAFRPVDVAVRIEKELATDLKGGAYDAQRKIVDEIIDTILAHGDEPLTFAKAQELKGTLQDLGKFNVGGDNAKNALYRRASGIIRDELEKSVEKAGGKTFSDIYLPAKDTYGKSQEAMEALTNRQSSELGNKRFGLTDTIAGGAGGTAALMGHPGAALATGAAIGVKKFLEKFGNTLTATSTEGLAKIAEHMPEVLGRYGPVLRAAIAKGPQAFELQNYLLQQRDPDYRATLKALQDDGQE